VVVDRLSRQSVEDVHVVPHRAGGHGPKAGRRSNDSSMLIDATLKQAFPPLALPTREFMDRARKIWDELELPALSPQPPWHGYTLGDWNDTWETYARRAVTGGWEQSGKETFAQKRGGLTPETPVRDADKPDKGGH
jgi:4-hydroxy-3-polyprenylbenzoate decarboxylase